jgi:hypothetical protein
MTRQRQITPKPLPAKTYILISVIGFLVSILCIYYYIHFIQNNVSEQLSQKVFYLVLILFGISASALIFGAMNSYGVLKGKRFDTTFQLTGPVVGVVLVVIGGFYLPKSGDSKQALSIRVVNEKHLPLTNGKVILYFSHYTREEAIDDKGSAVFSDISDEDLKSKIKLDINSDGYSRLTFDTLLKNFTPLELVLSQTGMIRISGKVINADDMPISNVVVMADGTKFFGTSVTNGTYSIKLADYAIGDEIDLFTSRKDYKDKTIKLKINRQEMTNIDFVLQLLKP